MRVRTIRLIKRVVGSAVAVTTILISATDLPNAFETWKRWITAAWYWPGIDWAQVFEGERGRWIVLLLGVSVGLWAWDVPQKTVARVKARRSSRNPTELTIHSALYGIGDGNYKDVTPILRGYIHENRVSVRVENGTLGGDPYKGKRKHLVARYSVGDGPILQIIRAERDSLVLPEPTATLQAQNEVPKSPPPPSPPSLGIAHMHRRMEKLAETQHAERLGKALVTGMESGHIDPAVEQKAKELERLARDIENPPTIHERLNRNMRDKADDIRSATQRMRRESASQAAKPAGLNVDVFLVSNGPGGTPGIFVRGTNLTATAIESVAFIVTELKLWDEHLKEFVTTPDIHDSGVKFPHEIELQGKPTLHPRQPGEFGFIAVDHAGFLVSGHPRQYRSQKRGIWRMSYRLGSDRNERHICFRWEDDDTGKTVSPAPCECPKVEN